MKLFLAVKLLVALLIVFGGRVSEVQASPWVEANDPFLRSSIEQLANAGYLQGHRTAYPLMWSGIARDLNKIDVSLLSEEHIFAFYRVRAALEFSQRPVTRALRVQASSASGVEDAQVNTFADTSHETAALTSATSFTGNHWAGRLQTSFRAQPNDGKNYHLAGSYLATTLGNWALSIDQISVWWGPAHENALVLSTNSMPMQAFRVNRLSDVPLPLLGALGHVHTSAFIGRTQSASPLGDNTVAGLRMVARPLSSVEFGASYVRHWASFEEPYNQVAGIDARVTIARRLGVYSELASNDSSTDNLAFTLGVDTHFSTIRDRVWQIYAEYTDVPEFFYDRSARYGDLIEPAGYRRWGYAIGAGQDQDVQALSFGLHTQQSEGAGWSVKVRHAEYGNSNFPLNLRYGFNVFSEVKSYQFDVKHYLPVNDSLVILGLGYRHDNMSGLADNENIDSRRSSELNINASWEFRF